MVKHWSRQMSAAIDREVSRNITRKASQTFIIIATATLKMMEYATTTTTTMLFKATVVPKQAR